MINYIQTTNPSNNSLLLYLATSGDDQGLVIFNLEGLGPPKATVNGLGGPNYDGVIVSSVKTDARHIVLTLAVKPGYDEETAKQKIYTYFPIKKIIKFKVATDQKVVYADAYVESVEMNQFAKVENAVISLYCPEPYWLDINNYSPSISSTGTTIAYPGEVSCGVEIQVSYSSTVNPRDITITNANGTQSFFLDISQACADIPLSQISTGSTIKIKTYPGEKSIYFYYGAGQSPVYNWFNYHTLGDDFIQLYLGNNLIDWDMSDTTGVGVKVLYRPLYEGV